MKQRFNFLFQEEDEGKNTQNSTEGHKDTFNPSHDDTEGMIDSFSDFLAGDNDTYAQGPADQDNNQRENDKKYPHKMSHHCIFRLTIPNAGV